MDRAMMKYSLIVLIVIGYLMLASSSVRESARSKEILKDYVFIPAGTEGDSEIKEFYISAIEVTNKQYREFLKDLRDSGQVEKVRLAIVDSSGWGRDNIGFYGEPHRGSYFMHPAYDDYPVVNISKQAAVLYCDWLTARFNANSKLRARFTLPTEKQWTYAARGGNPMAIYPWPGNGLVHNEKGKQHGLRKCNYRVDTMMTKIRQQEDFPLAVRSYTPNTYEIYNMGGNAAEMISDHDYTKGGSFQSLADKILIDAHEDFDGKPSALVGFRPVMVYESER